MARGGRRTYVRDSRGRFAGTPGGGAQAKGGTLGARSSLKKSRSKLASKDSTDQSLRGTLSRRSQKGAVTRGSKALKEAKASSRKSLSARAIGTISKKRSATESKKQVAVLGPRQVAGARKRASETTETFSKRKLSTVRSKLQDRQERYQSVSTSLNRRRGKLEGDDRRKAATEQRKLKTAIDKLKYAEQKYQTAVTRRQDERNWNTSRYNRGKAPQNSRTALNKLGTMRRRVAFLKKQGLDYSYDKYGERYATKKLVEAKKGLGDAVKGVSGQNVRLRTKKQASAAQATRRKRMLKSSINKKTGWKAGGQLFGRGVSRQENLLTGKADKVSGARLQPVRRKRKP